MAKKELPVEFGTELTWFSKDASGQKEFWGEGHVQKAQAELLTQETFHIINHHQFRALNRENKSVDK